MTDLAGYQAITKILADSGQFRRVELKASLPQGVGPEDLPLCWVQPGTFLETQRRSADHPQIPDRARVVTFLVNLLGTEDPDNPGFAPLGQLEELEESVSSLLEGQGLGGAVAGLTRVEHSEAVKGRGVRLVGSFTVLPGL